MSMPPLAWDDALGVGAATYAQQMAFTGTFQHSNRQARRGIGENLWMGTHGAFSIEAMVGGWAAEKRYFLPESFQQQPDRQLGRCRPLHPDDLADDHASGLCNRFDAAHRLPSLPLCYGRQHGRPQTPVAAIACGLTHGYWTSILLVYGIERSAVTVLRSDTSVATLV